MNTKFSRLSGGDKVIMAFAYTILGLFMAAIILPVVYIILASFIDPITLQNSGLTFDFSKWTLTAYERVMSNAQIWTGFKNAMIYSVLFTIISVMVTLLAAYPMSRPDFKGKGFFNVMFVITMFFGGGLIPTYLLISNLGMLDTIWAILIQSQPEPGMVSDMQSTAARAQLAELLKYATIIISSVPLMILYPFFQKYFDNGIMAGAVKG